MMDQETVVSAQHWVRTGVQWVENNAFSMGIKYLDRAIPVFQEAGDVSWLTYARHQRLLALKGNGRDEEVEVAFEDVMLGYVELDDPYGKALLLFHVAESLEKLGRHDRAMALLNLAGVIAQFSQQNNLWAHLLSQQAKFMLSHNDLVSAVRLLRQGEAINDGLGLEEEAMQGRLLLAEALLQLGERPESVAMLEDLQARLFRGKRYRQALEPLKLLNDLYEEAQMWNDKTRIGQLIHFCGQYILQNRESRTAAKTHKFEVSPLGQQRQKAEYRPPKAGVRPGF